MIRLGVIVAASAVAAGAALVPARPPQPLHRPPPVLPSSLTVDEREYAIVLSHQVVAAGQVKLQVYNRGMDEHNLTIKAASGQIRGTVWVQSGQSAALVVTLSPGRYLLYCSMFAGTPQSHEALGMHTVLTAR